MAVRHGLGMMHIEVDSISYAPLTLDLPSTMQSTIGDFGNNHEASYDEANLDLMRAPCRQRSESGPATRGAE